MIGATLALKPLSDRCGLRAVVRFTVTVRAERNGVVGRIGATVGETTHVMDLEERATVGFLEGRRLAAKLAVTVGTCENPALNLRVATNCVDFPLAG